MPDEERAAVIVDAVHNDPIVKAVLETQVGERRLTPPAKAAVVTGERGQVVAPPVTTEEQERVSAGQRAVNLIWETTQMKVALSVIWSSLLVAIALSIFGRYLGAGEIQLASVVFLYGVANLVTGFYFGRTNHQKVGGVVQGR